MQLLGESNFEIYSRYFSQYGWYWYGNTDSNITLLTSKSSSLTYAMCRFCNRLFMISRNIKNMKEVICPNCGKTHKKEGYVYSAKSETIFPLNASMKLYEMKDKLELRIKYIGLLWNETPAPNYEKIYGLKEKFVFDIKNHSCTWQKGRPYWDREKKKIVYKYVDFNNNYTEGKQEDRHTQREYYISAGGLYTPIEHLSFSLTTDFSVNTLKNNLPACPFPTRYTSLSVLAAQYKDNRLTTTVSLLNTFIAENVKTGDKPSDRKRLSPSASVSWRVLPEQNLRIRASFKDIFRVPTFNDMYYLRIGNTNLKPERATQYNLGMTWGDSPSSALSYLNLSVDGYYNRVRDKIVALPTLYIWKMMNMGEVAISGIDANLSAEISCFDFADFLLQGNYTWQKAIDITNESAKNYRDQIPYTPRHAGSASLSIQNKWLNVSYLLSCAGDRYSLPQNIKENRIDRYIEQTISVNKEFSLRDFKLRLQGEVLNVGNINYEIIKYYPMPGRSYRILVSCYF